MQGTSNSLVSGYCDACVEDGPLNQMEAVSGEAS